MSALGFTGRSLRFIDSRSGQSILLPPTATTSLLRTEAADIIVTETADAIATEAN